MKLMIKYLKGWSFMRLFRLLMGVMILWQGVEAKMWYIAVLGALFIVLAGFKLASCGGNSCSMPTRKIRKY